jgi:hypothetical protein
VAEKLVQHAPRAFLVNSKEQESSALSTLLLAQLLPTILDNNGKAKE